ncbi:single-stranded DNA-binding protein [bacterium]|nr:single-stranded DNA-binding protein [bacterium]
MYINKAIIFGNLTRDPELRALPSGMNVCSFSLATNRVFKDRDGKKQEQVDYHNISVFGRQADLVAQYLKKGDSAFVEGRIQTRSWEKDGQKQYRTEVVADYVQFGPRKGGAVTGGAAPARGQKQQDETPEEMVNPGGTGIAYPKDEINPDDIPF